MANILEKVNAEFAMIEEIIKSIIHNKDNPTNEQIIFVGLATYLQNFYNGIENILKQILKEYNIPLPNAQNWQKDLLKTAKDNQILSGELYNAIGKYLVFRRFFSHAYGFQLDANKLKPLFDNLENTYNLFKQKF